MTFNVTICRCRRNAVHGERNEKAIKEKSPERRKDVDVVVESIGDVHQRCKVCEAVIYTDKMHQESDSTCDKCRKVVDEEDCVIIKEEIDDNGETEGGAGEGSDDVSISKSNETSGAESRESRITPRDYERFVVQYNKTGIRYMQCDKCQFICRPLANIFHKHYQTHFEPLIEEDVKPDINVLEEITEVEPVPAPKTPPETTSYVIQTREIVVKKPAVTRERTTTSRSKSFSCGICGLAFKMRVELKMHKKVHANRPVSLCCNMCGKNFKTKSGYNHHRTNVCVQYTCEICGDLFLVKSVLQDHLKKIHGIEQDDTNVPDEAPPKKEQANSVCPVCGKMVTENALSRHMNLHTEDKPYICDLCGKQFRIKWSLREHIMIEIGMKDYVCEICGKKFVIQAYLNKHMRFHMMCEGKFEGYQCEICGKKYAEEWKVKEHQRNSHKGKNLLKYKCDICDKKYTRKWLVRSHKRTAHKDHMEEYQCNFCEKKFTEKWIIKLHLQTVHNINNTPATAGNAEDGANPDDEVKATSDELEKLLEYHQRISCDQGNQLKTDSSGEAKTRRKSFECELCGKLFATKQGMKNHLYAELNLRKYVCEICGKRYNWWMGLKEHSIMNHGSKEFVCAFCGKDFPTKKRCRDHLSVHSDDRPYNCKCGNSFKLRRYLAKHQKRCNKACVKDTLKVEQVEQIS